MAYSTLTAYRILTKHTYNEVVAMSSVLSMIVTLCGLFLLLPHRVESFSFGNRLLNLLRPSSTKHLADLLELYDVVQDPSFLASSEEWRSSFSSILTDVEVTSQGVVEGLGLIARRDFSAGEVVALYPYVAFFYIQIPGQS